MSDLIRKEEENSSFDILEEMLKITIDDIPIVGKLPRVMKVMYLRSLRKKWNLFLKYAITKRELFDSIHKNPKLIEYLTDYFETVRRTQSILAIKILALVFRGYPEDTKIRQRVCRALAEISEEEIEFFLKLFKIEEDIRKRHNGYGIRTENKCYVFSKKDLEKYRVNYEEFILLKTNLVNRCIILGDSELSATNGFYCDEGLKFTLGDISDFYKKYIEEAQKLDEFDYLL